MGSDGLWSNSFSWGASLKTWSVSLQYLWSFLTLPAHIKTKRKTRRLKTGKIRGWCGGFGGWVLRDSKSSRHGWRASKHQLLLHQEKTFTLQQLKHHLLVLFKVTFLCVHYPLTYLSSSHLLAVITLKKAKERKLMTSSNLGYPHERQKMTLKSCVCGVELKEDKSLLSLHQSLSWPLTRNMRMSLIPFCFCDAISSSHLSDRRYWGKCSEEWSRFEQPRSENGVGPSFICFLYLWWSTVQQKQKKQRVHERVHVGYCHVLPLDPLKSLLSFSKDPCVHWQSSFHKTR